MMRSNPRSKTCCNAVMTIRLSPLVKPDSIISVVRATSGWQRRRFRTHIAAAREIGKPLIIHCRDAAPDLLQILTHERAGDVGGVMHCFVEDWEVAQAALDLGFYISLSGIVTFKNATALKDVARQVPADRLLVETDAPWLAPVPVRGKQNEPAYVRHTAAYVAALREVEYSILARTTTANFYRLFPLAG